MVSWTEFPFVLLCREMKFQLEKIMGRFKHLDFNDFSVSA